MISERDYLRLANPHEFWNVLTPAREVDWLTFFTLEMWDMLTGIVPEWYSIRIPSHRKSAWGPAIISPRNVRIELCMDRHEARVLQSDVRDRYFNANLDPDRMSVFAGYGLKVENEFEREREGLSFLERQFAHLAIPEQRVIVVSIGHGSK